MTLLQNQIQLLMALEKLFEDEQKAALSIYSDVCSTPRLIWSNLLQKFKADTVYICKGQTNTRADFDLDTFRESANNLMKSKTEDIECFYKDHPSLARRYSDSLQEEIVNVVCSYNDFIEWQKRIKKLESERIKQKWKKALKILGILTAIIIVVLIVVLIVTYWKQILEAILGLLFLGGVILGITNKDDNKK